MSGIMFGNLSAKQMCERLGIEYTDAIAEMEKFREQTCKKVIGDVWHCYDLPLYIQVGSQAMADRWCKLLSPVSNEMKEQIGIGG